MAMFLSRIKKALNLGTKSITQNGTYNASSDGYDGYSSVEVNVAGVTPTPITPSNSNPAQMTADNPVNPTANGYAIESYSEVSPSSAHPNEFTSDDIVRFRDTGVIVDSITSITPDNSDPPRLEAAKNYFSMSAGYAISGYQSITPTNNLPTSIGSNGIYKPSASGYIIKSYSQETPSDTSPASVASGDIIRPRANGYLYSTIQPKVATGTFTRTTSSNNTINCGFAPDMIFLIKGSGTTTTISAGDFRAAYWNGWSTSYVVDDYRSSSGYYLKNEPMSDFFTITSTGFVYAKASSSTYAGTVKYIAVKYT